MGSAVGILGFGLVAAGNGWVQVGECVKFGRDRILGGVPGQSARKRHHVVEGHCAFSGLPTDMRCNEPVWGLLGVEGCKR